MRKAWKVFRAVVSALLLMAVVVPAALYVLLSLQPVRNAIRDAAASYLSELLGADVGVESVDIHPFRRLSVRGVDVVLGGDTVAAVSTVSAGIELYPLVTRGDIVIDYALVDGLWLKVSRPAPDQATNIDPILARLKGDKKGEKKEFNLEISTVVVRNASASYDVLSEPLPDSACFNANHVCVRDLAINAFIPQISKDSYVVSLDHLSFNESSGFVLEKLSGAFAFVPGALEIDNLSLQLPNSTLAFKPLALQYSGGPESIVEGLRTNSVAVATDGDCRIYPPDLKAFVPVLGEIGHAVGLELDASVSLQRAVLHKLLLDDADAPSFRALLKGYAFGLDNKDDFFYDLSNSYFDIDGVELAEALAGVVKPAVAGRITDFADLNFKLAASGTLQQGRLALVSHGTVGDITLDAKYRRHGNATTVNADAVFENVDLGIAAGNPKLGMFDGEVHGSAVVGRKLLSADVKAHIDRLGFNDHEYGVADASLTYAKSGHSEFRLSLNDPEAQVLAYGIVNTGGHEKSLLATAVLSGIDFNALGFDKKREDYVFGAKINAELSGTSLADITGMVDVNDIGWLSPQGKGIKADRITARASDCGAGRCLTLSSPYIDGELTGRYDFKALVPTLKDMAVHFMPAFATPEPSVRKRPGKPAARPDAGDNDFSFDFTLRPCRDLSEFFDLPVAIVTDATLSGRVDSRDGYASVELQIPYFTNRTKLIENTTVFGQLDLAADKSLVYATTEFETKKGDMSLALTVTAANNKVDTSVEWGIERRIPLNGTIDLSATLLSARTPQGSVFPVEASIDFLPGTINFGEDTWSIEKSRIDIDANRLTVDGFALDTGRQRIQVGGVAGQDADDRIDVELDDIRLLHIFETLEIDNVLIDGIASGHISARNLFGDEPSLECPALHVDSIGYNRCYFGDADVLARWDNEKRAVYLDAALKGFEGKDSHIYGNIFPMAEALDLNFEADSIPVGFLKPFMAAFTSDISGRASGACRLFGTFKEIDLTGDVFADNVKIKVDFTNVVYSATDSVHMRPGRILLDDITVRDPEGHTAKLNGYVNHTFFKAPVFRFDITGARDLLSYNISRKLNPDWHGTIYGNGSASISGYPGVVNIDVDMTTGPHSTFTFELSDRLEAEAYQFLTFRDVTPDSLKVVPTQKDELPPPVRLIKEKLANSDADKPSDYNMDIRVHATPDAELTLVMDQGGGDKISAVGEGSIHMAYHSANNDFNIWGKYKVLSGKYLFTLQDIIRKEFFIKEGSEIQFDGDPYGVKTSISAYYLTNANLSDLDESFQQDKEVARTNVPVHAIMNVSGDIRQPIIDFDLEFPTLTQDTYRKVRSIVSTPDMMNRQIIYLLTLNRFYTPDYMASTTKGSELFSVASSTISSQLGNMLGKLSDNWSISPNLRSDRGDFSDLEVDVALTSRLLNNRLIFNGNFGYRDKALNSNQFIGDFDVEYLLDKRGAWRLKAYNRYNDRNYYVRTAQTTQGVGIMFRRDFDSLLSFLKKKRKAPADSTASEHESGK